jgi:hypothetical protein
MAAEDRQTCTRCEGALHPGFIEDTGESSRGRARWIPGPLELGAFGGTKRWGKERYDIEAYRCERCGRLELFVN